MTVPPGIRQARADARDARARLNEDVALLRKRIRPANIVADLRSRAVSTVVDIRDNAADAARRKPVLIAAGIVALGILAICKSARRGAIALAGVAVRNRAAIQRFIETKPLPRKDQRP